METATIIAMVVAIPVILFPAAFVWYMTAGGVIAAARARARKAEKAAAEAR
jgi:hypothetical protein